MIIERNPQGYEGDMVELVEQFYAEALAEYETAPIDKEFLINTFKKYQGGIFLLVKNGRCVGLLAGQIVEGVLNESKIFQEVMWYVTKEYRRYGVYLLKEAETILRAEGCTAMVMVCLHNSKTEKIFNLYEKMGYRLMESHFLKNLIGEGNGEEKQ